MDMDLHLARAQQRWRYADDELAPGEALSLEALAHDFSPLPDKFEGSPEETAELLLGFFLQGQSATPDIGGSIEPVADDDGVLVADGDILPLEEPQSPEAAVTP